MVVFCRSSLRNLPVDGDAAGQVRCDYESRKEISLRLRLGDVVRRTRCGGGAGLPRTGRHDFTAVLNSFFCQRFGRTRPRLDRRQVSSYALRAESSPSLLRDSAAAKIGRDLLRPGGQKRICSATHTALWGTVAARCVWQTSLPDSQARLLTRICENSLSIFQLKEEFQAQKNRLKWPVSSGL